MRLTNKTKWDSEDLRKLVLETIKRAGYETNKRITVETGKGWGGGLRYSGRAGIHSNFVKMSVPKITYKDMARDEKGGFIVGSNGHYVKVEKPIHFDTVQFAKVLIHELGHNAGLQHEDMINYNKLNCEWAKELTVNPQQPKPKLKIDLAKVRYEKVLKKIKEKESKLKRLQTSLKKLYKQRKYYQTKCDFDKKF